MTIGEQAVDIIERIIELKTSIRKHPSWELRGDEQMRLTMAKQELALLLNRND